MPWTPNLGDPAPIEIAIFPALSASRAAPPPKLKSGVTRTASAPCLSTASPASDPWLMSDFVSAWTILICRPRIPPFLLMSAIAISAPWTPGLSNAEMMPVSAVAKPMMIGLESAVRAARPSVAGSVTNAAESATAAASGRERFMRISSGRRGLGRWLNGPRFGGRESNSVVQHPQQPRDGGAARPPARRRPAARRRAPAVAPAARPGAPIQSHAKMGSDRPQPR